MERCELEGSGVKGRQHVLESVLEVSFSNVEVSQVRISGRLVTLCTLSPRELEACNTRIELHMRRIAALLHNPRSSAHTPQVIGNTRAVVINGDFQWNAIASIGEQRHLRARCSSYASHVSRVHVCPGANEQSRNFQASICSSTMKGREPNVVEVTRLRRGKGKLEAEMRHEMHLGAHPSLSLTQEGSSKRKS